MPSPFLVKIKPALTVAALLRSVHKEVPYKDKRSRSNSKSRDKDKDKDKDKGKGKANSS